MSARPVSTWPQSYRHGARVDSPVASASGVAFALAALLAVVVLAGYFPDAGTVVFIGP